MGTVRTLLAEREHVAEQASESAKLPDEVAAQVLNQIEGVPDKVLVKFYSAPVDDSVADDAAMLVGWRLYDREWWEEYVANLKFDFQEFPTEEWPLTMYVGDEDDATWAFCSPDELGAHLEVTRLPELVDHIMSAYLPTSFGMFPHYEMFEPHQFRQNLAKWAEDGDSDQQAIFERRYGRKEEQDGQTSKAQEASASNRGAA